MEAPTRSDFYTAARIICTLTYAIYRTQYMNQQRLHIQCRRRGLTVQQRAMLDAAQSRGEDYDHDEQPWHYVLYYRRQPKIIRRHGYLVLAVRRDRELLAELLDR